jgi:hypothetical protein
VVRTISGDGIFDGGIAALPRTTGEDGESLSLAGVSVLLSALEAEEDRTVTESRLHSTATAPSDRRSDEPAVVVRESVALL